MANNIYDIISFRADLEKYGVPESWDWYEETDSPTFYFYNWTSEDKREVRCIFLIIETLWASILSPDRGYEKGLSYIYNFGEFQEWLSFLPKINICEGPGFVERTVECTLMILPEIYRQRRWAWKRCIPCRTTYKKIHRRQKDAERREKVRAEGEKEGIP